MGDSPQKNDWVQNYSPIIEPLPPLLPDDGGDVLLVEPKNAMRIEEINMRMSAHREVTMRASPMARVMRRDWNILSAKLYVNARDARYARRIKDDLSEMAWVISDIAEQVRTMPFREADATWLRPRKMHLQIIHPMTASWLRAMVEMDEAFSTLICAERAGLIDRKRRHQLLLPSQLAYMGFKATAMKIQLRTAEELMVFA